MHDLCRAANDRIASSNRSGEIEWIVVGGGMKLVYTAQFERENTLRVNSTTEQERRRCVPTGAGDQGRNGLGGCYIDETACGKGVTYRWVCPR